MTKNKYQLTLLIACLVYTSQSVHAADPNQLTGSDVYSSAGAGWDNPDLKAVNPDSDTSNQEAYSATATHLAMPVNQNGLVGAAGQQEYTANKPGAPSFNPVETQIVPGPGAILPEQFQNGRNILPNTSTRLLTPLDPRVKANVNGLPPTILDSFVQQAGGEANNIYGDEGSTSYPSASNFGYISSGFHGQTKQGLTTGHGSRLPSAWGHDGVHGAGEWSDSAPASDHYASPESDSTNQNLPAQYIPTN